ncbi:MAG: hypothetical protein WCT32_05180 [Patescibacteria group bacterium]|jgi:hypothetical protein
MLSKIKNNAIYGALMLVLIAAAVFYWKNSTPIVPSKQKASSDSALSIKQDAYSRATNVQETKSPLSTSTAGFGRNNPFSPYK